MPVLIGKMSAASRNVDHDDPVHVVLIAIPRFVRSIFSLRAFHLIDRAPILETSVHIYSAAVQTAARKGFPNRFQTLEPGGRSRAIFFLFLGAHMRIKPICQKRISQPFVRRQPVQMNAAALQHIRNGLRTVGNADFSATHNHFLVARQGISLIRRHVAQEKGSTAIQQPLHLCFRRIWLRMIFTEPVFQTIPSKMRSCLRGRPSTAATAPVL